MKTNWTKGLTKENSEIVTNQFKESKLIRRRLGELISEKIKSAHTETRKKELYMSPSWAYLQADAVGYERALFEIISLLED